MDLSGGNESEYVGLYGKLIFSTGVGGDVQEVESAVRPTLEETLTVCGGQFRISVSEVEVREEQGVASASVVSGDGRRLGRQDPGGAGGGQRRLASGLWQVVYEFDVPSMTVAEQLNETALAVQADSRGFGSRLWRELSAAGFDPRFAASNAFRVAFFSELRLIADRLQGLPAMALKDGGPTVSIAGIVAPIVVVVFCGVVMAAFRYGRSAGRKEAEQLLSPKGSMAHVLSGDATARPPCLLKRPGVATSIDTWSPPVTVLRQREWEDAWDLMPRRRRGAAAPREFSAVGVADVVRRQAPETAAFGLAARPLGAQAGAPSFHRGGAAPRFGVAPLDPGARAAAAGCLPGMAADALAEDDV